jgi:hypothetical protein
MTLCIEQKLRPENKCDLRYYHKLMLSIVKTEQEAGSVISQIPWAIVCFSACLFLEGKTGVWCLAQCMKHT